ncbi:hypothetical protein CPC08DRAFT_648002 [Agrocybe pediades]|nr:hypothetical protein CPC08DRAFT_648002 [Agrocybe pediades]
MFGFNVTTSTPAFNYDNRPVAPIKNMNFEQWWFHGHLDFPPNDGDIFELPAGEPATAQIACNKGATDYFASSEGGDIREPWNLNNVCPNSTSEAYHTLGKDDLEGCALAIAYKNDAKAVQPEDFTVFSVNQTCVWTRFTDFQVPARMPPCPEGGCICAFFWIHSPDSGGEENYMNGFKCNVTGSTSTVPVAQSKVPRRCGADIPNQKLEASPSNCTYGAKTPFYWFNNERNNMPEGTYSPPVYNDLYNFLDGAQDDIFEDSYTNVPPPSPNAPMPVLGNLDASFSPFFAALGDNSTIGSTVGMNGLPQGEAQNNTSEYARRTVCSSAKMRFSGADSGVVEKRDMSDSYMDTVIRMNRRRRRRLHAREAHKLWHMW